MWSTIFQCFCLSFLYFSQTSSLILIPPFSLGKRFPRIQIKYPCSILNYKTFIIKFLGCYTWWGWEIWWDLGEKWSEFSGGEWRRWRWICCGRRTADVNRWGWDRERSVVVRWVKEGGEREMWGRDGIFLFLKVWPTSSEIILNKSQGYFSIFQ